MGLSWLKTYLIGDERYKPFLTMVPTPMPSNFKYDSL
jgi:hypothetical protein